MIHVKPRARSRSGSVPAAVLTVLGAASCVGYEPAPFDPREVVDAIARGRAVGTPEEGVDLATATAWLAEHGPAIRDAIAAFRTADALAAVPTPLPNPQIQFGPTVAFGAAVTNEVRPVAAFSNLAIQIPISDRRNAQNELNLAIAEARRIEAVLALRLEYLGLRAGWADLAAARTRGDLLTVVADAARRATEAGRALVEAGAATGLDAALLELERARADNRRIEAALVENDAAGAIAMRTGVALDRFARLRDDGLPDPPAEPIAYEHLVDLAVGHRPELVQLRAEYAVAEHNLRLQVELQYPDIQIGVQQQGEGGEFRDQLSLGIGLTLPLFARNQQPIASALAHREQVRIEYENAAKRALADLERLYRRVELLAQRRRNLVEDILPRAEANFELARRSALAGSTGALRLLDVQRSLGQLRVEALDARLDEIEAWVMLERAVGHPLIPFPGEPDTQPDLPDDIDSTTEPNTTEATRASDATTTTADAQQEDTP
jgi:cobalt-zinc-cadmium efflux system outer membrane protein